MRTNESLISVTRYFALIVGAAFALAGIAGFLPFFTPHASVEAPQLIVNTSYGFLLGLFPVNIVHNLFHFAWGVTGLLASRTYPSALKFSRYFGVTLAILAIMGLLPPLRTGFGLMPLYGHDIWLHGLEAVIGIYLGFFAAQKHQVQAEKAA
ncbi:MAG TPA: DUF4383 domain-containing protein [Anaerolineales bacterium]|nr:DUF4383 domain-containing protein [Anaerolineales bacterium]